MIHRSVFKEVDFSLLVVGYVQLFFSFAVPLIVVFLLVYFSVRLWFKVYLLSWIVLYWFLRVVTFNLKILYSIGPIAQTLAID